MRRGGRVAEGNGLLNRHRVKSLVAGSNPALSATRLLVALQERIQELEKFEQVVIGRELKMIELEKELKRLKENSPNLGKTG